MIPHEPAGGHLDGLMRKVLPEVFGLRPFAASNDVAAQLDARRVVLIDGCPTLRSKIHVSDPEMPA